MWESAGLKEWIAIDLETTGLDASKNEIIELGAVRFVDGKMTEQFSRLVKPSGKLPREITQLTGITDDDLSDALPLEDAAQDFVDFIGEHPLVGHHISFDLGFLEAAESFNLPSSGRGKNNNPFDQFHVIGKVHDTNLVARFLLPCADSYSLTHLIHLYQIHVHSHHRATEDAQATGELFARQMQELVAVPYDQLSQGFRFVENTPSCLANSLRSARNVINSGYEMTISPRNPLTGQLQKRNNVFKASGDPRSKGPISDHQIHRFFHETDRFKEKMPAYEIRPQQAEMAVRVMQAIRQDQILTVEAGTGVGKSLGYLVPALLSGKRVILSTYTKTLQDQLFYDEIPRLGRLFKFSFQAALLKGRRNYLCRTKWRTWANAPERVASPELREKAAFIVRWVNATQTGDISEINAVRTEDKGGFFRLIVSEPGYCTGRICKGMNCPLPTIRRAVQKADLVVVNHSLVMADIRSEAGLLGEIDCIVLDEAHHLEDAATDQFGSDLTAPIIRNTFERIGQLCRRNGELWVTLAARNDNLALMTERISADAGDLISSVDPLFRQARGLFPKRRSKEILYSTSLRYSIGDKSHKLMVEEGESLLNGIQGLTTKIVRLFNEFENLFDNGYEDDDEDDVPYALHELQTATGDLYEIRDALILSLQADDPNRVHWVELPSDIKRPVRIQSAPLDIADILTEQLWDKVRCAVLTSATLSTSTQVGGFQHILNRLGLNQSDDERVQTALFGSPFDYDNNCLVCYPTYIKSPANDPQEHIQTVADIIAQLSRQFRRGTLVLFTSYRAMWQVKQELHQSLAGSGLEIFTQGGLGQRGRLIHRLKRSKGAILLGTASMWEGIDLPGKALEIVVIPRLPFSVPDDPIVAARIDHIRNDGGNPFWEYQVPTAALRLRQGTGRLIRSTSDRGVILILDPRVTSKGYGKDFRGAVHGRSVVVNDKGELEQCMIQFFDGAEP